MPVGVADLNPDLLADIGVSQRVGRLVGPDPGPGRAVRRALPAVMEGAEPVRIRDRARHGRERLVLGRRPGDCRRTGRRRVERVVPGRSVGELDGSGRVGAEAVPDDHLAGREVQGQITRRIDVPGQDGRRGQVLQPKLHLPAARVVDRQISVEVIVDEGGEPGIRRDDMVAGVDDHVRRDRAAIAVEPERIGEIDGCAGISEVELRGIRRRRAQEIDEVLLRVGPIGEDGAPDAVGVIVVQLRIQDDRVSVVDVRDRQVRTCTQHALISRPDQVP